LLLKKNEIHFLYQFGLKAQFADVAHGHSRAVQQVPSALQRVGPFGQQRSAQLAASPPRPGRNLGLGRDFSPSRAPA
jgi:hypothetical protein